jgi:two component transcriptional regulator, araC family
LKIVIIDDEPKTRNGLSRIISQHENWDVVQSFSSAEEAIPYLTEISVDVVITDIRMPGKNGLDMIAELHEYTPKTSFIILSGYELFEYAKRSIDLKVQKFLVKPVSPSEVHEVLEQIEMELTEKNQNSVSLIPTETNNLLVFRTKEYIYMNYKNKCSLKDAASVLFVSPNYLSNLFKEKTGENFSTFLMNVRMEKSLRYLMDVKYTISEISEIVGFTDYRYYCTAFRKKYGNSPKQYRNSHLLH